MSRFSDMSLEEVRARIAAFADERDWQQYHTPRNLLLALVREVGELSEIFQWRGEVAPSLPDFSDADRTHLGEELADVLLYLVRLSDRCNVDLAAAVKDKLRKNADKYPLNQCKGRANKYTDYGGPAEGAPSPAAGGEHGPGPAAAAEAAGKAACGGCSGGGGGAAQKGGTVDPKRAASLAAERAASLAVGRVVNSFTMQ